MNTYENEIIELIGEEGDLNFDDLNDEEIILEIEIESENYNALYESYVELTESAKIDRHITIKSDPHIKILTRNKNNAGGKAGNISNHAASIKIIEPKRLNGVSIYIPPSDELNDKSNFRVEGKYSTKDAEIIKTIEDIIIQNRFDFANIFYTDKTYSAVQSYKRLIKKNVEFEFYNQPNTKNEKDDIYEFYKKKRGITENE